VEEPRRKFPRPATSSLSSRQERWHHRRRQPTTGTTNYPLRKNFFSSSQRRRRNFRSASGTSPRHLRGSQARGLQAVWLVWNRCRRGRSYLDWTAPIASTVPAHLAEVWEKDRDPEKDQSLPSSPEHDWRLADLDIQRDTNLHRRGLEDLVLESGRARLGLSISTSFAQSTAVPTTTHLPFAKRGDI